MNQLIATVAVEKAFFSLDSDYDYLVKASDEKLIKCGTEVVVPFGKGNVKRKGIVVNIFYGINDSLKEIISVSDKQPICKELVDLALWLKERSFCTTYDCLKQMLPRGYGKIRDAGEKMVMLKIDDENELPHLTPKQKIVCDLLFDIGSATYNEVKEFCSVGDAVIKNLEKYGVVEIYNKEKYRMPFKISDDIENEEIILSSQQQKAFFTYKNMMDKDGGIGLLYGVTGSGKTLVYLKLIDEVIKNNKDVIVMVPEISLTPQMFSIFIKRYGKSVAIIHSGLSMGERNDEFKRIDRGEAKIVVGTRSASFAPLHNLGLIIMDEEQESSYKSERTPRYHARDVAKFRAKYNGALFLMTSATPSVESYCAAKGGKYVFCELNERYGKAVLPEVITVDMKEEMRNKNHSPLSNQLKELMAENFENNKQTILLINRRGYNTFIACNDCGHVLTCPNCSISLTYHSYNNSLMCHYCGYTTKLQYTCPECHNDSVRYSGYGTQRIEDEIAFAVPNAKILRMDKDTTSTKFSHQKLFDAFKNHEYDILVGTQMIAKGLDFDDVTLVGVVNADNSRYNENYISAEKCFDLITQVIGRSGRRDDTGKAVIQTINPYDEVIEYASNQDYKSFYNNEIEIRKLMTYPPFCDIYSVSFVSASDINAANASKSFFDTLVELNKDINEKIIVLGPSPAKISKINNNFRYRLAIKCKNSKKIRTLIRDILKIVSKIKECKEVSITVDLNPYDLT